ncbi:MAG: FHA domain-containing protein [Betaproteobacteria bacterium]
MGKLVLFLADGTSLDIRLERERVTIGRRADNDICLPYPAVSGEHASVVTILADSFLEDLGSTNGTLVNGKPVAKHFLRDRDQIDIGRQKLVYVADDSVELEPTPPALGRLDMRMLGERVPPARVPPAVVVPAAGLPDPSPFHDVERFVAAELAADARAVGGDGRAVVGDGRTVASAAADATSEAARPVLQVLTGPSAGRTVPLSKPVTSIGRVGRQVAAIHRDGDTYRIVAVEGSSPPLLNGEPLPADGALLVLGDRIEIAGARLECVAPDSHGSVPRPALMPPLRHGGK